MNPNDHETRAKSVHRMLVSEPSHRVVKKKIGLFRKAKWIDEYGAQRIMQERSERHQGQTPLSEHDPQWVGILDRFVDANVFEAWYADVLEWRDRLLRAGHSELYVRAALIAQGILLVVNWLPVKWFATRRAVSSDARA